MGFLSSALGSAVGGAIGSAIGTSLAGSHSPDVHVNNAINIDTDGIEGQLYDIKYELQKRNEHIAQLEYEAKVNARRKELQYRPDKITMNDIDWYKVKFD